jgi:hypothetical protein
MFKEIVQLISDLTGFAIGSRLQYGHKLQDAPVRAVLVQETGGEANFYCPDMINMTIQVLCRAAKYSEAREDAYAVFEVIHGTSNWELPRLDGLSGEDYLAMTVEALAAPQYLGEDDNRRHLFSTNYVFRMELGSCGESGSGS